MALNAGMKRARGEILFFTDVRQDLEPDSLSRLVACFGDPAVGVVSGELVITKGGGSAEEATDGAILAVREGHTQTAESARFDLGRHWMLLCDAVRTGEPDTARHIAG